MNTNEREGVWTPELIEACKNPNGTVFGLLPVAVQEAIGKACTVGIAIELYYDMSGWKPCQQPLLTRGSAYRLAPDQDFSGLIKPEPLEVVYVPVFSDTETYGLCFYLPEKQYNRPLVSALCMKGFAGFFDEEKRPCEIRRGNPAGGAMIPPAFVGFVKDGGGV